ncbi:MAG: hypothetical protein M1812_007276 [Candelaria pacifica]|nr:MAG: hypothetical protein M1812_007276 [Candelaria pacifica]
MSFGGSKDNDLGLTLYPGLQSPRYGKNLSAAAEVHQDASVLDHGRERGDRQSLAREGRGPLAKASETHEPLNHPSAVVERCRDSQSAVSASAGHGPEGRTSVAASRSTPSPSLYQNTSSSTCVPPVGAEPTVSHRSIHQSAAQWLPPADQELRPARSDEVGPASSGVKQRRRVKPRDSLAEAAFTLVEPREDCATISSRTQYAPTDRQNTVSPNRRTHSNKNNVGGQSCSAECFGISTSKIPLCAVKDQRAETSGSIRVNTPDQTLGNATRENMSSIGKMHALVHGSDSGVDCSALFKKGLANGTSRVSDQSDLGRLEKEPTSPFFDELTSTLSPSTSASDLDYSNSLPSSPSCTSYSIEKFRPHFTQVTTTTGSTGSQPANNNSCNCIRSPQTPPEATSTFDSSQTALQYSSRVPQDLPTSPILRRSSKSPILATAGSRHSRPSLETIQISSYSESSSSEYASDTSDSESDTGINSPRSMDTAAQLAILEPIRVALSCRLHHTDITASVIGFIQSFDPATALHHPVDVPKTSPGAGHKVALLESLNAILPVLRPHLLNPNIVSRVLEFIMAFPTQQQFYQNGASSSSGSSHGMTPQPPAQNAGNVHGQFHTPAFTSQQSVSPHRLYQHLSPSSSIEHRSPTPLNWGPFQAPSEERNASNTPSQYVSTPVAAFNHTFPLAMSSHQPATNYAPSVGPTAIQQPTRQTCPGSSQQRRVSNSSSSQSPSTTQPSAAAATAVQMQLLQQNIGRLITETRPTTESEHKMHQMLKMARNTIDHTLKKVDEQNQKIHLQMREIGFYKFAAGKWAVKHAESGVAQGHFLEREVDKLRKALQLQTNETQYFRQDSTDWMNLYHALQASAPHLRNNITPPISTPPSHPLAQVLGATIPYHNPSAQPADQAVQPCNLPPQTGEEGAAIDLTKSPELEHTQLRENSVTANGIQKRKFGWGETPGWVEVGKHVLALEAQEALKAQPRSEASVNGEVNSEANPRKRRKVARKEVQIPAPMDSNLEITKPFDHGDRSNLCGHNFYVARPTKKQLEEEQKAKAQQEQLALEAAENARLEQARIEQLRRDQKEQKRIKRQQIKEATKLREEERQRAAKLAAEEERVKAEAEAARKAQKQIDAAQQAAIQTEKDEELAEEDRSLDALFEDSEEEEVDHDQLARNIEDAMVEDHLDGEDLTEEELESALMEDTHSDELIIDWGEEFTPEQIAAKAQRDADFQAYAATRRLPQPPIQDESEESEEE